MTRSFGVGDAFVQAEQVGLVRMTIDHLDDDVVEHVVQFVGQVVERFAHHPLEAILRDDLHRVTDS